MERQNAIEYPKSLAEKYRPEKVEDFIGIARAKAMMQGFLKAPRPQAFIFVGASGTGKTSLAIAVEKQLPAEVQHVPSRECDLERVQAIARRCQYYPWSAKFWLVRVDEADQMSHAAQLAWLSKLDGTDPLPNTVIIFTANSTRLLEDRFLSRCIRVDFGTEGINGDLTRYLARIWEAETGKSNGVDFRVISEAAGGNVREALMRLDAEILAGGVPDEPKTTRAAQETHPEVAEVSGETSSYRPPKRCAGKDRTAQGGPRVRFIDPKREKFSEPGWTLRGQSRNGRQVWVKELQGA